MQQHAFIEQCKFLQALSDTGLYARSGYDNKQFELRAMTQNMFTVFGGESARQL